MTTTIGSLCSGYGGLDQGAEAVTGGTTVWHCEYDAAPSAILAHRYPDVPNYGDLKALEWADDPVDVLTAGYPCQPFSGAGKRLGTDDPRHLFPWIVQGVERMRPPLLLFENVRGHLSLGFDVVLAELDRIGYDVRWTLLRAADIGAPHGRSRLWIAGRDRSAGGWPTPSGEPTALAEGGGWVDPASGLFGSIEAQRPGTAGVMVDGQRWDGDATAVNTGALLPTPVADNSRGLPQTGTDYASLPNVVCSLLPTPRATDGTNGGPNQRGSSGDLMLPSAVVQLLPTPMAGDAKGARNSTATRHRIPPTGIHGGDTLGDLVFDGRLLPTPAVNDMGAGKTVEAWDDWTAAQKAKHGNGNGHGPSLHIEAARMALLPTPAARDWKDGEVSPADLDRNSPHIALLAQTQWGIYAAAIARWENLTRPAPAPTEQGRNGPRLSPAFVEWMMGLPDGWVTDVPGISRNNALKALGNGVCPAQAAAAYSLLGVSTATVERRAAA